MLQTPKRIITPYESFHYCSVLDKNRSILHKNGSISTSNHSVPRSQRSVSRPKRSVPSPKSSTQRPRRFVLRPKRSFPQSICSRMVIRNSHIITNFQGKISHYHLLLNYMHISHLGTIHSGVIDTVYSYEPLIKIYKNYVYKLNSFVLSYKFIEKLKIS